MILCQSPLGRTTGLPERRTRRNNTTNKHAASSIYSLYVHPAQHDSSSLGLLLPTHLPRSRSNDRQAARLFGTPPPHVSSLSPRSVERACASQHTLPHQPLHHVHIPSSTREFVVAVALARTARTPRRRLGIDGHMQPFAYRDEGLVVQMVFLFASPVRGRTTNLPTSRVR